VKGGVVESVLSIPQEDGSFMVSVATDDMIQEWLFLPGGHRVLLASVYCPQHHD